MSLCLRTALSVFRHRSSFSRSVTVYRGVPELEDDGASPSQFQEFSLRNPTSCTITVARRSPHSLQLKSTVGYVLAKTAALRINLNIDGAPIASRLHTHPLHSQTSRLLTSSLSLGVPVPRVTQCMRGV